MTLSFWESDMLERVDKAVKSLTNDQHEILKLVRAISHEFFDVSQKLNALSERVAKVETELAEMRKENEVKPFVKLLPKSETR